VAGAWFYTWTAQAPASTPGVLFWIVGTLCRPKRGRKTEFEIRPIEHALEAPVGDTYTIERALEAPVGDTYTIEHALKITRR
jgi:hypothetical protein